MHGQSAAVRFIATSSAGNVGGFDAFDINGATYNGAGGTFKLLPIYTVGYDELTPTESATSCYENALEGFYTRDVNRTQRVKEAYWHDYSKWCLTCPDDRWESHWVDKDVHADKAAFRRSINDWQNLVFDLRRVGGIRNSAQTGVLPLLGDAQAGVPATSTYAPIIDLYAYLRNGGVDMDLLEGCMPWNRGGAYRAGIGVSPPGSTESTYVQGWGLNIR